MKLTDVHAHLAALPTAANGCRLSRRMRNSPVFRMLAYLQGLSIRDPDTANRRYVERLSRVLAASEHVGRAVLLAMDGTYDREGRLDEKETNLLISNDYLFSVVSGNPAFLAGVSVNPVRRDAIDELERCAARGAALVKVLPNAQAFDPADRRHIPYYQAMARLGLPLLSHIGFEFTLIGKDQSVGNPERLIPALEEGVTVIAAHGCSNGLFVCEKHFDTMLAMIRRYPNFYVDTSALTFPNRVGMLFKIRRHPELHDRLIFGTDYPVPVLSYPALATFSPGSILKTVRAASAFDRHYRVLEALGMPPRRDFLAISKLS